jgi:putative endonuclease
MTDYSVYVIRNAEGRCYIGLSEDVLIRLKQHNTGASKWTRGKGPWKLIWSKSGMSLTEARVFEKQLKRQKGGAGFYRMTGLNQGS